MKTIPFILLATALLASTTVAWSQTKLIAHRSHSGQPHTMTLDADDNFGDPPMLIMKLEKFQDSMVIQYSDAWHNQRDTFLIKDHPYFRKLEKGEVRIPGVYSGAELIGFDEDEKASKTKKRKEGKQKENGIGLLSFFSGNGGSPFMTLLLSVFGACLLLGTILWKTTLVRETVRS